MAASSSTAETALQLPYRAHAVSGLHCPIKTLGSQPVPFNEGSASLRYRPLTCQASSDLQLDQHSRADALTECLQLERLPAGCNLSLIIVGRAEHQPT